MSDRKTKAAGQIPQEEHFDVANSKKVTGDVLAPGKLVTADTSAAGRLVGKNSLCRIRVTLTTYVAFGNSNTMAAVTSTTDPGLELFAAGVYLVTATDDFIRTSAAVARLEVLDS